MFCSTAVIKTPPFARTYYGDGWRSPETATMAMMGFYAVLSVRLKKDGFLRRKKARFLFHIFCVFVITGYIHCCCCIDADLPPVALFCLAYVCFCASVRCTRSTEWITAKPSTTTTANKANGETLPKLNNVESVHIHTLRSARSYEKLTLSLRDAIIKGEKGTRVLRWHSLRRNISAYRKS